MTSEVDKILARVAQVAENNPIARDIFEQRQAVGQQLPEGMQPHSEYRFNPTTDALESTESDGRFMAYADGMDSLKDVGLGGLKGGIGLLDLGLTTTDTRATQLKNGIAGIVILPTYSSGVTLAEGNKYKCYIDDIEIL